MKKTLSILSLTALLLMGGLFIVPAYAIECEDGCARVPEPASLMLLATGLAGVAIWRRKSH